MILTLPPHSAQVSISIPNTRFNRFAQVIAARHSAGVWSSSSDRVFLTLPRFAGVTSARCLLLGANTPWKRVRLTLGCFPFGHGKEIYFWSFVVAMLIFALGGTVSIYKGWQHLFHPTTINNILINYAVLGFAIVFEGAALWVAFKEFNLSRGSRGIISAITRGKDPTLFVVVFEDTAALLGLFVAMGGLVAYQITGNPVFDALASIGIGVVLIFTALILALESKSLLIGESADPEVVAAIDELLATHDSVSAVNEVATLHMGPEFIVVTVSIDVNDALAGGQIEKTVTRLTRQIKATDPRIQRVFIEMERSEDHYELPE